jgi:hypothetical protein
MGPSVGVPPSPDRWPPPTPRGGGGLSFLGRGSPTASAPDKPRCSRTLNANKVIHSLWTSPGVEGASGASGRGKDNFLGIFDRFARFGHRTVRSSPDPPSGGHNEGGNLMTTSARSVALQLSHMDRDQLEEIVQAIREAIDDLIDWDNVDDNDPVVRLIDLGIINDLRRRTHRFTARVTIDVEVDVTTTVDEDTAQDALATYLEHLAAVAGDVISGYSDDYSRFSIDDDPEATQEVDVADTDIDWM